jgi:hypothetical protein
MSRWVQAVTVGVPGSVTVIALVPTYTVPRHLLPEVSPIRYCQTELPVEPPLCTTACVTPLSATGLAHASTLKLSVGLSVLALGTLVYPVLPLSATAVSGSAGRAPGAPSVVPAL